MSAQESGSDRRSSSGRRNALARCGAARPRRTRIPARGPGGGGGGGGGGEVRRREAALHQDRGQRLGNVEVGGERRRETRVGRRRDRPAGGDHSRAYSSTPQASQPSIDAPRWINARRWVGTAVKQ